MNSEAIIDQTAAELGELLRGNKDAPRLLRRLFDGLGETLSGEYPADHIGAPNAVVEVIDQESGILYRRYLELEYDENDNGIRLIGENLAGESAQLIFLSETALKKMQDLRGHGRDTPRCEDTREVSISRSGQTTASDLYKDS